MENQLNVKKNAPTAAKRCSNTDSKLFQKHKNKLEPVIESDVESDVESIVESDIESDVESDEELAINEKVKLIDLEKGKYFIPRYSKIEVEDEKKGGLLLLANVESGGFKNVIVSYKYIRELKKLLEKYEPYQICVKVIEDRFTATKGHNAGKTIVYNKLDFKVYEKGTLKKLSRVLKNREFVDGFDEDFADEIIKKVYNEDKNMEEHFLLWSDGIDEEKELTNEKRKRAKKK